MFAGSSVVMRGLPAVSFTLYLIAGSGCGSLRQAEARLAERHGRLWIFIRHTDNEGWRGWGWAELGHRSPPSSQAAW